MISFEQLNLLHERLFMSVCCHAIVVAAETVVAASSSSIQI